jgi:lysophospholipase L1-like esterase
MNTNSAAKSVLCFGDSNTNGVRPDRSGRFAADVRWPGVLQSTLGEGYYVIEEGLGGRTTDLDHPNPDKQGRNGLDYFKPCLHSHMPVDVIVIMLGTNDLKNVYDRAPEQVAKALGRYHESVVDYCAKGGRTELPLIVLASPAYIADQPLAIEGSTQFYDQFAVEKSHALAGAIKRIADELGCEFLDAGPLCATGEDGLHIDAESHQRVGLAVAALLQK